MTFPRFIHGKRGSEFGVFISPPGVDASVASADELTLHITTATAQIAMMGVVAAPFPRDVPHGLGYAPIVLPNLISTKIAGGWTYNRPFDGGWAPYTNSMVQSSSDKLTFIQSGDTLDINFFAFNRALP